MESCQFPIADSSLRPITYCPLPLRLDDLVNVITSGELAPSLRVARELGVNVPAELPVRADEVIR